MSGRLGRRDVLRLGVAAAGVAMLPAWASQPAGARGWRWTGTALGARSTIVVDHPRRDEARRLVGRCLAEVRRLERVFSLFREDSALSVLNRNGALDAPPPELLEVLSLARTIHARTRGAFDVSVQPLWDLHRRHFSESGGTSGPGDAALREALAKVDAEAIEFGAARIRLRRRGMALTLNGIAQGYVADRIAKLAGRAGCDRVLLDVGEIRALGEGWRVGLPGGDGPVRLERPLAVATSMPAGFRFEPSGAWHHLLDPQTGRSASRHRAVTVLAPSAALADGLSTACALLDASEAAQIAGALEGVRIRLLGHDGDTLWLG